MQEIKKEIQRGLRLLKEPMRNHYLSLYRDWCLFSIMEEEDPNLGDDRKDKFIELEVFKNYFMKFLMGFTYRRTEENFYEYLPVDSYVDIENGIFDKIERDSGIFAEIYEKTHRRRLLDEKNN